MAPHRRPSASGVGDAIHKWPQEALAQATDEELTAAVDQLAQTEAFWGQGDPATLRPLVHELDEMARDASQQGLRLYRWVCV